MSIFRKMVHTKSSYVPAGNYAVWVRPSAAVAAIVTDKPIDTIDNAPLKDMQEICVVVVHPGEMQQSDGTCGVQIVRRSKDRKAEVLYELFIALGSEGKPLRQTLRYEPDAVSDRMDAIDWVIHLPLGQVPRRLYRP